MRVQYVGPIGVGEKAVGRGGWRGGGGGGLVKLVVVEEGGELVVIRFHDVFELNGRTRMLRGLTLQFFFSFFLF